MRIRSSHILPIELAALLGGMSWWHAKGNKSSATCPHYGPASVDPGSDEMVEVGAISIDLPHH